MLQKRSGKKERLNAWSTACARCDDSCDIIQIKKNYYLPQLRTVNYLKIGNFHPGKF